MSRLFRVILPVSDIQRAAAFYASLFDDPGKRVSPNRHYFDCGGTILACCDPREHGNVRDVSPNPDHIYFAVENLEDLFTRAQSAGCRQLDPAIKTRPWGERSFYAQDPFGNPICFVDQSTLFTG